MGGGYRDRKRPCSVGVVWGGWDLMGQGFPSIHSGELLLTNSFASKVHVEFIKSMWAQRQAPQTNGHLVPSSHTSSQMGMVHRPQ